MFCLLGKRWTSDTEICSCPFLVIVYTVVSLVNLTHPYSFFGSDRKIKDPEAKKMEIEGYVVC